MVYVSNYLEFTFQIIGLIPKGNFFLMYANSLKFIFFTIFESEFFIDSNKYY